MKEQRPKSIFSFNDINEDLSDSEISGLKELNKYYYKKYWLFKTAFKHYKKIELACNIGSAGLVVTGSIVGGVTLNPIALGTISGAGLLLKTFAETKHYKRKIEMSKFAYTSYEKILTDLRYFLRGSEFNDKEFLDYIKVVDEIIIDMCPLTDKFEDKYKKMFKTE